MPDVFVSQLLFLYRYIFVLAEETMKVVRARDMRSFGSRGKGIKTFVSLIGTLFLRTVERSERIYLAMLSRGFSGTIRPSRTFSFSVIDATFLAGVAGALYIFRMHDVVGYIGRLSMGAF